MKGSAIAKNVLLKYTKKRRSFFNAGIRKKYGVVDYFEEAFSTLATTIIVARVVVFLCESIKLFCERLAIILTGFLTFIAQYFCFSEI